MHKLVFPGALATLAALVPLALLPSTAHAERPVTILVPPPDDYQPPSNPAAIGGGLVIYFNRNGGTYTQVPINQTDSALNRTSLPGGTLTPFACGDAAWQQVMDCLRETWGDYNVVITDKDPGATPHAETVVAGSPEQVGQNQNVGGIAPASCLFVDRPISYAFANVAYMQCDPEQICWTASQETAHYFGLDHQVNCKDPMTYDSTCGVSKRFQNETVQCGETKAQTHSCFCGGSMQNSHQKLLQIFGARADQAPTVKLSEPADGATVQTGFAIKVDAQDDIKVTRVELFIDGTKVQEAVIKPFVFLSPADLTLAQHTITVRAFDKANHTAEASAVVTVEGPCKSNDDCDTGQVCNASNGQCLAGPGESGGVGSTCTDNTMCTSGICAQGPDGMRCVTLCSPGGSDCPDGFSCLAAGGSGACWPGEDAINPPEDGGGTCGCRAGGRSSTPLFGFLLGFAVFGLALRRRRR